MTTKTIKDVDEETWKLLKEMAHKRRLKMGALLKEIAIAHKKRPSNSWNKILRAKPVFTEKEARAILRTLAKLREEVGYRNVIIT